MNNTYFQGMARTLLLAVIILLPAIAFTSCGSDDDDEQPRTYGIGITSMSVSGISYLSVLQKAEKEFDNSFTLTGSQETCDIQAKAKFAAAITVLRTAAATVTDCSGYIIYALSYNGDVIASEQIDFVKTPN